ncbi:MAG: hypothetical protein KDI56_12685, partial [Xanthomonadales bacterium]|nr:hypothetical protein [Xanthomonadales bacterium]
PGDIAKIPAESFALFTQLRDEFDKAHAIRNRLVQALEDADRTINGVLDMVEKVGDDFLNWVSDTAAVATFRKNLQTFVDQGFEIPANVARINVPGLIGTVVTLPLSLDRLAIPFEQAVFNAVIQNLPAELLYPIHLGVEHAGNWFEIPGELNARLQMLAERSNLLPEQRLGQPTNELELKIISSVLFACNVMNHLLEGVQAFSSRDTTVGIDVVGEGFAATFGANPLYLLIQLFRTLLQVIVDVMTYFLTVLAADKLQ